jgi:DNA-binding helix-hairpin-helix protein with protein kinase domain
MMPPRTGSTLYGTDGSTHQLFQEIGKGGQGSVWSLSGEQELVAKFYHNGISSEDLQKLEVMVRLSSDALASVSAWPLALLKESKTGKPQGLLMRRIANFHSVNQLYSIKSRLKSFPEAQFPFLLHGAINTARAFATIHDTGQVVGDVNHSNLMVSHTATVAMIDCDSFQITNAGKTFLCPVGVPEFTPPELQGGSFASQLRTAQHDAFGLSVLIFYLLFLGRHPFMGVFDTKANDLLSLDQAIARYAFPYALSEQSPEVRLPPFAPRLSDYPATVGELFKRAFTRESLQRGRPTAHDWVSVLSSLAKTTKVCGTNPNHHYFSALSKCPWCRVEGVIGAAIFGIKITAIRDENFNLIAVWAMVEAIRPMPEPLEKPDVNSLQAKFTPDPALVDIVKRRRAFRFGSLIILVLGSTAAVALLGPFAAVLLIVGLLVVSKGIWSKGAGLAKPFYERFSEAASAYKQAEDAFDKTAAAPTSFNTEKQKLSVFKTEYEGLSLAKAARIKVLEASRERKQRQHFLERFRIEDDRIANIGPKNKVILAAWGIEDAWDVEDQKIAQIKGFGPVKRQALVDWRREKERLFKFESAQPIDPRDIHALEQEFSQKASSLRSSLSSGPEVLKQSVGVWQAQRRQALAVLSAAGSRLAHAGIDKAVLNVF